MKNLYRSRDGRVVHYGACSYVKPKAIPWRWAEKQTREYVLRVAKAIGTRPCSVCKPFGDNPYPEVAS